MKTSLLTMMMFVLTGSSEAQSRVQPAVLANNEFEYQAVSPSSALAQITVRHIHDSGWSSHLLQVLVTQDSLLLRGNSEFRDNRGNIRYCTFPADILLTQIVKVEAKRGNSSLLRLDRLTKLHLEFKDEKGQHHTLDFLSQDAAQNYNEWHEGPNRGSDLLRFAEVAQNAVYSRVEELRHSPPPVDALSESAPSEKGNDDGSDPIPAGTEMPSGQPGPTTSSNAPADGARNRQYAVQVIGTTRLYPANVSSPAPFDPNKIIIVWNESHGNNVVSLEDILVVRVKQRPFSFRPGDPNTILELRVGEPSGPRLYVLDLEARSGASKKFIYRFVSDEAVCYGTGPCKDGADNGQHVLDLARTIKETIASRAGPVKSGTSK